MCDLFEKTTAIACELAALLMVVEECDVNGTERENLISLARRVADNLAVEMMDLGSAGGKDA